MSGFRLILCLNCLSSGAKRFPVGPEKGPQMDRYQEQIDLCDTCAEALVGGDFATIADRYSSERNIPNGRLT